MVTNEIQIWGEIPEMEFSATFLFLCICLLMCSNNSPENMWKTC